MKWGKLVLFLIYAIVIIVTVIGIYLETENPYVLLCLISLAVLALGMDFKDDERV